MSKKINNVIFGGLTVGTLGVSAATVGMAADSFKSKDILGGVAYTLASMTFASMGVVSTKELININKKKK